MFKHCEHENIVFNVPLVKGVISDIARDNLSLSSNEVKWKKNKYIIGFANNMHMPNEQMNPFKVFGELLDSDTLSDITFFVGNIPIRAHKLIVAYRSPYWKSMLLESHMFETKMNEIVISEVKYENFKKLLCFMYTDEFEEDNVDNAMEILKMADMYLMPKLKSLIEFSLIQYIDQDNVRDFYELSQNIELPLITTFIQNYLVLSTTELNK